MSVNIIKFIFIVKKMYIYFKKKKKQNEKTHAQLDEINIYFCIQSLM